MQSQAPPLRLYTCTQFHPHSTLKGLDPECEKVLIGRCSGRGASDVDERGMCLAGLSLLLVVGYQSLYSQMLWGNKMRTEIIFISFYLPLQANASIHI